MISVIVPTYNERENVPELLQALDAQLNEYDYEIVIVDDDSPDDTWRVAESFSDEYPIEVVRRTDERGRASAVLEGIRCASYDIVVGFDADLQIPPEKIPELVTVLEAGADICVAGKYRNEQGAESFGPIQKILSRGENLVAKILFPELRQLSDVSDFFAMRSAVLEGVDVQVVVGPKLIANILVQGNYDNVEEIEYVIGVREAGESKLGVRGVVQTLSHYVMLWYHEKVR